jgi:hypothetical protein
MGGWGMRWAYIHHELGEVGSLKRLCMIEILWVAYKEGNCIRKIKFYNSVNEIEEKKKKSEFSLPKTLRPLYIEILGMYRMSYVQYKYEMDHGMRYFQTGDGHDKKRIKAWKKQVREFEEIKSHMIMVVRYSEECDESYMSLYDFPEFPNYFLWNYKHSLKRERYKKPEFTWI